MSEKTRRQEMRILASYRNERAESKSSKRYFPVPGERVSFTAIPTVLLESEVWKSLGIYARRFIDEIIVLHARAGGCKNGYLILTHQRLKERGIEGDRIKPTIENLVKLGLLEVTHKGGPADPSRYRVTFLPHRIEEPSGRVTYYPPFGRGTPMRLLRWLAPSSFGAIRRRGAALKKSAGSPSRSGNPSGSPGSTVKSKNGSIVTRSSMTGAASCRSVSTKTSRSPSRRAMTFIAAGSPGRPMRGLIPSSPQILLCWQSSIASRLGP